MPDLPVHPNLEQLKHQAKDLLRQIRQQQPDAKLAGVQQILARSYGVASWPRLVHACQLIDAIWADDLQTVERLVTQNPRLMHEPARGGKQDNWGPPMSYAANIGRDRIIQFLHSRGATDHAHAIDRAILQGQIATARMLHEMMGRPTPGADLLGGAAYTLSASGTQFALELGAPVKSADGRRLAPVHVALESDSRKPAQKHRILELYVERGLELPNTAPMAVHRGRIDLLESQLHRDPGLLHQRFRYSDIFPPDLGCDPRHPAAIGSPLDGVTLLHLAIEYDEFEIARWLLDRGIDVNARAVSGHSALFGTVVSYPNFWMNYRGGAQAAPMTELLLACGADPALRASLRHEVGWGGKGARDYVDVTPVQWGEQFVEQLFVSRPAIALLAAGQSPRSAH